MTIKIGLDTSDVKEALRRRHPAYEPGYVGVGRWTCIEEWRNVDLLALDAWSTGHVIGYEIKVSRGDMRTELLRPDKRSEAVAMCTRFYFAVPAGLLTHEEKVFQEPLDWVPDDFKRSRCPGIPAFGSPRWKHRDSELRYGGQCEGKPAKGSNFGRRRVQPYTVDVPVPATSSIVRRKTYGTYEDDHPEVYEERILREAIGHVQTSGTIKITCPTCNGKGYTEKSRVEREAPQLWVPNDVGLIEIDGRGCRIVREAPGRAITEPIIPWPYLGIRVPARPDGVPSADEKTAARIERQAIAHLVRWVSARPDPRHHRLYSDRI